MPRTSSKFTRAFAATVAILVVLCGVFALLGFLSGPRLENATVDAARVVESPNQQLRLFANQPLAAVDADQVTIDPAAEFSVAVAGDAIAVQFSTPLDYDTDYSVRVEGVTNTFDDQAATLDYSFRTGSPDLYYLDRATDGGSDAIVRTTSTGSDRSVVYTAASIQDFVRVDQLLAVVTLAQNDEGETVSVLTLVGLADNGGPLNIATEQVTLPTEGTIDDLHASDSSSLVGFTFTEAGESLDSEFDNTLFTVDLGGLRELVPVTGLDGNAMRVSAWDFVPGTTSIVAQNRDESVVMVDVAAPAEITPLGQFTSFDGISPDGATITVGDRSGAIALDTATRGQTPLPPSEFEGAEPYGGAALALDSTTRVQRIAVFDDSSGRFSSYLVLDDGTASRTLFQTVNDEGEIGEFSVSSNGQFVALEVTPNVADSVTDGYRLNARSQSVTTVIVDLDTGAVVRSFDGFGLAW